MPWIWHFFFTNVSFFMGLYFLTAGYFVPKSYDRHGGKEFVRKKLIRLGIPLVVMGGLLSLLSGKFLFIGIVSTVLSFVFTWLVRMIPGVKNVL